MKQVLLIILTLALSILFSACSDGKSDSQQTSSQAQVSSVKIMTEAARVSAVATPTADSRIAVSGTTNLPDKTELLISLSNEAVGFNAQDKSIVSKGGFSAGPLGSMSGVSSGNYTVEVMMPIPSVQPESVQLIVGKEGEYLSGPLVKNSSWGGKTVEYSFPYTVGSKEAIQNAQSEHDKLVTKIRKTIEGLLQNGRSMEEYRNSDDLAALKTCGEMMRKNQAKAKMIRAEAETLPMKYFDLRVAAIEVYSCVSCSGTALDSCSRVGESIDKAK